MNARPARNVSPGMMHRAATVVLLACLGCGGPPFEAAARPLEQSAPDAQTADSGGAEADASDAGGEADPTAEAGPEATAPPHDAGGHDAAQDGPGGDSGAPDAMDGGEAEASPVEAAAEAGPDASPEAEAGPPPPLCCTAAATPVPSGSMSAHCSATASAACTDVAYDSADCSGGLGSSCLAWPGQYGGPGGPITCQTGAVCCQGVVAACP